MVVHSPQGRMPPWRIDSRRGSRSIRKILQRINQRKLKILCTLQDEGCEEARSHPQATLARDGCPTVSPMYRMPYPTDGGSMQGLSELQEKPRAVWSTPDYASPGSSLQLHTYRVRSVSSIVSAIDLVSAGLVQIPGTPRKALEEANLEVESVLDDFPPLRRATSE